MRRLINTGAVFCIKKKEVFTEHKSTGLYATELGNPQNMPHSLIRVPCLSVPNVPWVLENATEKPVSCPWGTSRPKLTLCCK
jgi:hypothetical protein